MSLYSPSGHVDWHLPEVVSRFSELPESHSVHSESDGPVHLEQDEWQLAQTLGLAVVSSYSPSGHADSQVFDVVSILVDSQTVHSSFSGPEHSTQSPWQFWQTSELSGYFPAGQEFKHWPESRTSDPLHSVHSVLLDPKHSLHEPLQG